MTTQPETGAAAPAAREGGDAGEAAGSPPDIWTQDPAAQELLAAKGWDKLDPPERVRAVLTSYRNLEGMVGTDKLALPAKGDDGSRDFAEWDGWKELGAVDDPASIELRPADGREFTPVDKTFQDQLKPALVEARLAPWQIEKLNAAWNDATAAAEQHIDQHFEHAYREAVAENRKLWGGQYDEKSRVATEAAKLAFGEDLETAQRLEVKGGGFVMDHPLLQRAFAALGERIGESAFLQGHAEADGPGVEQLQADPNFTQAYLDGSHPNHADAVARFKRATVRDQAKARRG